MSSLEARERLTAAAGAMECAIEPAQVDALLAYLDLLQKWNKVYNLTAVREPGQMLTQHLIDSLAVVAPLNRHLAGASARVLDVGSGGGLPGIVLALMLPAVRVMCVDAVAKKASFIRQAAAELKISNLQATHGRVEAMGGSPFDVVTSRAFASLPDFIRLSRGTLGDGGVWLAMKGHEPVDEMRALPADIEVFHVEHLNVPGLDAARCLVWMRPAAGAGAHL